MEEVWKDVEGWEGIHAVSNLGRVKSYDRTTMRKNGSPITTKGRIMAQTPGPAGHPSVGFSRDNKQYRYPVHRLMAKAFIPNPNNLPIVRHLNDRCTDNRLENLAWGTRTDNANDAVRNGRNPNASKTHCKRGHEFTEDNIYRTPSNPTGRHCLACKRQRANEYSKMGMADDDPRHGTHAGYCRGCRCIKCGDANREYQRKRKRTDRS